MMKKIRLAILLSSVLIAPVLAHDLFLKLDNYFVKPGENVSIKILNGSFAASEGAVSFDRLADVSVVGPLGDRLKPVAADVTKDEKTAYLNVKAEAPGTYVAGLSTMSREIDLSGKDFNEYLSHDGIPDTLAERKAKKQLGKAVRERYSKHVKIIFQSGDQRTDSYATRLGYPVEIVPVSNPYSAKVGDSLQFLCLKDGVPLINQFVMTGHDNGKAIRAGRNVRTDKNGIATVRITAAGQWYVKFIHMARLSDPKLNYESTWASLSFAVR
jgi:uncharacterized GH25 family protein